MKKIKEINYRIIYVTNKEELKIGYLTDLNNPKDSKFHIDVSFFIEDLENGCKKETYVKLTEKNIYELTEAGFKVSA